MANRTDSPAVQKVLLTNYRAGTDLAPFITPANVLTTWLYGAAAARSVILADDILAEIEKWLAAHFYQQVDRGFAAKTIGKTSGTFDGKTGMLLKSTLYGQTAILLDVSGVLRDMADGMFQQYASLDLAVPVCDDDRNW